MKRCSQRISTQRRETMCARCESRWSTCSKTASFYIYMRGTKSRGPGSLRRNWTGLTQSWRSSRKGCRSKRIGIGKLICGYLKKSLLEVGKSLWRMRGLNRGSETNTWVLIHLMKMFLTLSSSRNIQATIQIKVWLEKVAPKICLNGTFIVLIRKIESLSSS